jgi:hypothetical protein
MDLSTLTMPCSLCAFSFWDSHWLNLTGKKKSWENFINVRLQDCDERVKWEKHSEDIQKIPSQ